MEKSQDEKKTAFVVLFSAVIMVLEIFFGLFSNSMALLADGIHMGSHVLAIGLSWRAYVLVRHLKRKQADNIDSEKVLTLAAYTAVYCYCSLPSSSLSKLSNDFSSRISKFDTSKPWLSLRSV